VISPETPDLPSVLARALIQRFAGTLLPPLVENANGTWSPVRVFMSRYYVGSKDQPSSARWLLEVQVHSTEDPMIEEVALVARRVKNHLQRLCPTIVIAPPAFYLTHASPYFTIECTVTTRPGQV